MGPSKRIEKLIRGIERDHEHGAHYFAEQALDVMCLFAEEYIGENSKEMLKAMWRGGRKLIEVRPSMSSGIIHAVTGLWDLVLSEFLVNPAICPLKSWVREKEKQLLKKLDNAIEASTSHAAEIVPGGATVFLFSYSSSIIKTIEKAASKNIKVIVAESRPMCEGVKTADECANIGIDTTLITDAQAGIFIRDCSVVLIGADSILPSGDVINKAGSSLIAAAASGYGVPLYVAAHSWKIHTSDTVELEEVKPSEVLQGEHAFRVRNIYFDITRADDITSIITETGPISPCQIVSLAEKIKKSFRAFLSNPLSA